MGSTRGRTGVGPAPRHCSRPRPCSLRSISSARAAHTDSAPCWFEVPRPVTVPRQSVVRPEIGPHLFEFLAAGQVTAPLSDLTPMIRKPRVIRELPAVPKGSAGPPGTPRRRARHRAAPPARRTGVVTVAALASRSWPGPRWRPWIAQRNRLRARVHRSSAAARRQRTENGLPLDPAPGDLGQSARYPTGDRRGRRSCHYG